MFSVVLFRPEIPPNTGNIIRLCANAGVTLHLIEPLGFALEDRRLRRAGLDYHELAVLHTHPSLDAFVQAHRPGRILAYTRHAARLYTDVGHRAGDALLFGPETVGLPAEVLAAVPESRRLRLPMRPGNRSLNLSNAVAIACYEAWRQCGFRGG
jgi:tRNA (cytidine/uridine-2'-O-)-methyltransferase